MNGFASADENEMSRAHGAHISPKDDIPIFSFQTDTILAHAADVVIAAWMQAEVRGLIIMMTMVQSRGTSYDITDFRLEAVGVASLGFHECVFQ